jgi:hypothetical protein
MKLQTKLLLDAPCFTSDIEKIYYAFGRLRDKASQRILPWLTVKQSSGEDMTWEGFISTLDKAFGDPDLQRKSLVKVNTMKQGRKPLEEFLNEFDETMLNAGGLTWSDEQKKGLLDTAISLQILKGMVGKPQAPTYEGYCEQLRAIDHDLKRIERLSQAGRSSQYTGRTLQRGPLPGINADNRMDWEPTPRVAAVIPSGKRARRVDAREIQRRKDEHRCLRCGSSEHFINRCPHKAPKTDGGLTARSARVKVEADIEDDTSDESEEGDQGKE